MWAMLWLEARIVEVLSEDAPPEHHAEIERYVDECLRDMPEFLRLGVALESIGLGLLTRLTGVFRPGRDAVRHRMEACARSHVDLIRQYVRMLHSLVVFASLELSKEPETLDLVAEEAAGAAGPYASGPIVRAVG
jgi:hypothetical protein